MFYKYKVTWYNSYEDKELTEEGLVFATSYGTAADAVVQDYGIDNVIDVYLYNIHNEGDGHCINKEEINYTFKD